MTVTISPSISRPSVGISQRGAISGALFVGFIVYLVLKGRLATYFNLLFKTQAKPASPVATSQSNNSVPKTTNNTANTTSGISSNNSPDIITDFGDGNVLGSFSGTNGPDNETFNGGGSLLDNYTGPTYLDNTTGF